MWAMEEEGETRTTPSTKSRFLLRIKHHLAFIPQKVLAMDVIE